MVVETRVMVRGRAVVDGCSDGGCDGDMEEGEGEVVVVSELPRTMMMECERWRRCFR